MSYFTVTRKASQPPSGDRSAWRLELTVAALQPTVLPAEIFVYHRVRNYGGHPSYDIFECVASLQQIGEIGLTPITTGANPVPYYRRATLTLDFRHADELELHYSRIVSDIEHLAANAAAAATLVTQAVTTI